MNEEVLAAISRARWNETVRVDVQDGETDGAASSSSSTILLVPRLDPQNGGVTWEQPQEPATTTAGGEPSTLATVSKRLHLRTKKWIFPMLHDRERNRLYDRAIQKASVEVVRKFLDNEKQSKPNDDEPPTKHVSTLESLDIGSGTGLLALLSEKHLSHAWRKQQRSSSDASKAALPVPDIRITSFEMARPMADLARDTVQLEKTRRSKSTDKSPSTQVQILEGHSCQVSSLQTPLDGYRLCTSELLESGLLGEGWLPAMRDAWERHLHPKAVVVPQKARIKARLVEGASSFAGPMQTLDVVPIVPTNTEGTLASPRKLRLFTTQAPRDDPSREESSPPGMLSDASYDPLTGTKHGSQVAFHADRFLGASAEDGASSQPQLQVLSDPLTALSLDVTSPDKVPPPEGGSQTTRFTATANGRADGILFWWELDLYGNDLTYSTKPDQPGRFQDHWHQCLYVFPPSGKDGKDALTITQGTEYKLVTSHTDSRVHFSVESSSSKAGTEEKAPKRPKPTIPPDVLPVVGPRRCWQLNDVGRSAILRDGIALALDCLSHQAPIRVLDVSDFSLCGILASLLGAHSVTSIESSSSGSGLPLAAAKVAQIGNGLPVEGTHFQIVQCHPESLTRDVLLGTESSASETTSNHEGDNGGIVDLVVGEPYYEMLEEWPIETALNYFYTIRGLRNRGLIRPKALCVPARAIVWACGIECSDLGDAYRKEFSSKTHPADSQEESSPDPEPPTTTKLRSSVCGFDHAPVVECWNYERDAISIPLWEYNMVVPVTEIVEVGALDYESNKIHHGNWVEDTSQEEKTNLLLAPFSKDNRVCHAIAFWVDYKIRKAPCERPSAPETTPTSSSSASFETLSTGFLASPPSICVQHQTVRILAKARPTVLGESLAIPRNGLDL